MKDDSSSLVPFSGQGVDIVKCNEVTAAFGIRLSQHDVKVLLNARTRALARTGRVEYEGGVIEKLVTAFCDSPYLMQDGFADAMEEMIDVFYEFKNDTLDGVDDDDAIELMKRFFDRECAGSLEWLRDDLGNYARGIRYGDQGGEIYDE